MTDFPADYFISLEEDNPSCGYCGNVCHQTCSDWEDGRFELDPLSGEFYYPEKE